MPVIGISVKRLIGHLGQDKSIEELVDILESLGCDVEDATQMVLYDCPVCHGSSEALERDDPPRRCGFCGHEQDENAPDFEAIGTDEVVRLDLLPDRPDLFDPGGLARAIKGFLGIETGLPSHDVQPGEISVSVDPALENADSYRPHIACAEVTIAPLTPEGLRDLMKLQENLHWGIGRDRKLSSIGIYDLSTVTPPIQYKTIRPDALTFRPLGMPDQLMTPQQVLEAHPKGMAYAHLLAEFSEYPLLIDSTGQVLSMPPIINSDETRLRVGSERLFIDVTGITQVDVERTLNTLVASMIEMGGTLKSVQVAAVTTPDLTPRTIDLSLDATNRWLGLELDEAGLREVIERMRLDMTPHQDDADRFTLTYSAFRSDVKHPVDLMEDVAIGYGYPNFDMQIIPSVTPALERPEETLSNRVRAAMLGLGFDEVLTLMQQTEENHFRRLRTEPGEQHAKLANPKSADLNLIRTHLRSGLLELLEQNKRKPAPLRLFEIGNVVHIDAEQETGTREIRRLAFIVMGPDAGYDKLRATLDGLLHELGWQGTYAPVAHRSFIEGRTAELETGEQRAGLLGELHPEVITAFGLPYPVAACELDLMRVI